MKTIKNELNIDQYIPEYIPENKSICFLDIETDGLSHFYNKIVLIGLNIVNKNGSKIIQVFSDTNTDADEKKLLVEMSNIIETENISVIYTYNGATFDIPFITKKLNYYRIYSTFINIAHIDLIKVIRANRNLLNLENCKLKTVEKLVGINREDTISGKESVLLYKEYLKTKNRAIENTILKHNYEDILYLSKILELEDSLRTENNMIISHEEKDSQNNRLDSNFSLFELIGVKQKKENINIKANALSSVVSCQIYAENYTLHIDSSNRTLELSIDSNKCRIGSESTGQYFDLNSENIDMYKIASIKNDYGLGLPENIMMLSIDDKILMDNIKNLLIELIKR